MKGWSISWELVKTLGEEKRQTWQPKCIGHVCEPPASGLKVIVWGCISYHGVGSLAFNKTWTLKNTLKHRNSIRSHQFANSLVLINGPCQRTMHQFTSASSLTYGTDSTKCQFYHGRHSHQMDAADWKCTVSTYEYREKSITCFKSASKKISSTNCRLHRMNCLCGHSEDFLIQFHIVFAGFSFQRVTWHGIKDHHTNQKLSWHTFYLNRANLTDAMSEKKQLYFLFLSFFV